MVRLPVLSVCMLAVCLGGALAVPKDDLGAEGADAVCGIDADGVSRCERLTVVSTKTLNDGHRMPVLGLGVYQADAGHEAYQAVLWALEAGYRHIDTAALYANEEDVGRAVRDSGVPRREIFITTKLWNDDHGYKQATAALDRSLERLGMDYVDLYLIHAPVGQRRLETWRALEAARAAGKARSIGVSNYGVRHLEELLAVAEVPPAVNQIELSPYLQQRDIADFCASRGITVAAYSPLTRGERLKDPRLIAIGAAHGGAEPAREGAPAEGSEVRGQAKAPAQVLIRWALQQGYVVLPKSVKRDRIAANADVFDFSLSEQEMASMEALEEGLHTGWDPTTWA